MLAPAVAEETFASLAARADAAREGNHLEEATALYLRALALQPSWKEGWWSLATVYYDRDDYAKAIPAFQHLLQLDPKNGTAYAMLGLSQFELKKDSSALRNIQKGLSLGILKDEALRKVVLYHEGLLFLRQSRFGSAQQALSLLASYGVKSDDAALALGRAVLRIPDRDLPSEGSRNRAIVLQAGRAETLGAQKQFEQGDSIYQTLVTAAPEFPGLHYAYGRFLLLSHANEKAIAEFEAEIKNDPRHVQSYLQIAAVHYRVDSPAGIPYAERGLALNPNLPFTHFILGLLYVDNGEYEKAIPHLRFAEKTMQQAELYYALGNAYAHTGQKQQAVQCREKFRILKSQESDQDEPNIYGQNPNLHVDPASPRAEAQSAQ